MVKQRSFTGIEKEIRHTFRNNVNIAESDEDVKKFFTYAIQELLQQAYEGKVAVKYGDICLDREAAEGFVCNEALKSNEEFMRIWNDSDLSRIVRQLAENGLNRIKHLEERHPDKSEAKIYPAPSHAGQRHRNRPAKKR